jgi:chromosome segregation ATPase
VSTPTPDLVLGLQRLADELAALRQALSGLTHENAQLRARLELSEAARRDLSAQAEHLVELLAEARREVRALQQPTGG